MTAHYERRRALSHKPRGRTGSGNAKLDDTQREFMRKLYASGKLKLKEIAAAFSVSYATARKVCNG